MTRGLIEETQVATGVTIVVLAAVFIGLSLWWVRVHGSWRHLQASNKRRVHAKKRRNPSAAAVRHDADQTITAVSILGPRSGR